jgi:uncharacterized protein (TIGR02301 family)
MAETRSTPEVKRLSLRDALSRWPRARSAPGLALALVIAALGATSAPATSRAAGPDGKPYDDKLLRLAEIMGAVHYLRELCSANEGQLWRERMKELLDAEGSSALRRARLTRSFNQGYRSYNRTYVTCTPSAQNAVNRFLSEGLQISEGLVKSIP